MERDRAREARSSPFPGGTGLDVAAAVLAAGRGSRFGGDEPKCLAEWRGRPLVTWALEAALTSGLFPVLLVTGHGDDSVARRVRRRASTSCTARVAARASRTACVPRSTRSRAHDAVGAVCVGLADQPRVGAEAYRRLAAAFAEGGELAVATYDGTGAIPSCSRVASGPKPTSSPATSAPGC